MWNSPDGDAAGRDCARGTHVRLLPYAAAALTAYGEAKLARLRALQRRWDPDNLFRLNHNIQPG